MNKTVTILSLGLMLAGIVGVVLAVHNFQVKTEREQHLQELDAKVAQYNEYFLKKDLEEINK